MIDVKIIIGSHISKCVFIPRVTLTPSNNDLSFILKWQQFPIRVAFSMTINKSQGQILSHIGLYLPRPVFSHSQLYVALSRIILYQSIKVLIRNSNQNYQTKNVVYNEIFQSI